MNYQQEYYCLLIKIYGLPAIASYQNRGITNKIITVLSPWSGIHQQQWYCYLPRSAELPTEVLLFPHQDAGINSKSITDPHEDRWITNRSIITISPASRIYQQEYYCYFTRSEESVPGMLLLSI